MNSQDVFLNLASVRECTEAEGPGRRFALWVQGCKRRCSGCCNPQMQPFIAKNVTSVNEVEKLIKNAKKKYDIEGVSFIGGEPIWQAKGLSVLAQRCQKMELSVLVFTGFYYEDLLKFNNQYVNHLLQYTDLLIDGPFMEDEYDDERDWIGSKNQRVIYLTERYSANIERFNGKHKMEIIIDNSSMHINGWPY